MVHRRTIPALDGVRGIAILLVLACHLSLSADAVPKISPLAKMVRNLMASGWTGVDLFFVLSGFLITGILIDTRNDPNRARTFYFRRCLRILPLYYLVVILGFLIVPKISWLADAYPSPAGWLSYVFYVQNWWIPLKEPTHQLFGQFWSLGVEEQFYLFWPLCVWFVSPKYLARVCIGTMGGVLLLRFALVPSMPAYSPVILENTVTRMDSLLCGALCAIAVRDRMLFGMIGKILPWCAALCFLAIAFIFEGPAHEMLTRGFYTQTIGFTLLAIGYSTLVLAAYRSHQTGSLLERGLSLAPLRMFGKFSYGIYVYHGIIFACAQRMFQGSSWYGYEVVPSALFCLGAVAASLCVAIVSYELVEKRFLALKEASARRIAPSSFGTETPIDARGPLLAG